MKDGRVSWGRRDATSHPPTGQAGAPAGSWRGAEHDRGQRPVRPHLTPPLAAAPAAPARAVVLEASPTSSRCGGRRLRGAAGEASRGWVCLLVTSAGVPRWRTARPNVPVVVPAPGEEELHGEPVAACSGGLGVDGGAAETAVAGRTSLLSHLFFRLQPPTPPVPLFPEEGAAGRSSWSVSSFPLGSGHRVSRRPRLFREARGGSPWSPPLSPSLLESRSPSLQMVGGGRVPGGSCTPCTTWCGPVAPTGRLAGDSSLTRPAVSRGLPRPRGAHRGRGPPLLSRWLLPQLSRPRLPRASLPGLAAAAAMVSEVSKLQVPRALCDLRPAPGLGVEPSPDARRR